MIKVGFFLSPTFEWIGGINYFRNLFAAINEVNDGSVQIILFLPSKIDVNILDMLIPAGQSIKIVRTSLLQRYTPYWILWKLIRRVFRSDLVALPLCKMYGINIVSHSDFLKTPGVKIINWIPDFQHIYLPKMFKPQDIRVRNSVFLRRISSADRVIVSSRSVATDLIKFFPEASEKIYILNFACQAPDFYWNLNEGDRQTLKERYKIVGNFFYVPNQFWRHKNHTILVDAIRTLRDRGIQIQIVCSGVTDDPRDPHYFQWLKNYIAEMGCADSFHILGKIPANDVYILFKFSLAVLNPSYFEGWSTTVEEGKSLGKKMLLSDLAVHHDQMPEALFFDVQNSDLLVEHLEGINASCHNQERYDSDELLKNNRKRTVAFGNDYLTLLNGK